MINIRELNNIYKSGIDKTWSDTEIPDKLIEYLDYLKSKFISYPKFRVLDIGCGRGRLIEKMTNDGWKDVTGIEIADEAMKCLLPQTKSKIITGNFITKNFDKKFNIVIDLTMTCTANPNHCRLILDKVDKVLEKNGYYLGEFFIEQMRGNKLDKTWYLSESDLKNMLAERFEVISLEKDKKIKGSVFFFTKKRN